MAVAKQHGVILGSSGATNFKPNIEERKAKADAFAAKLSGLIDGFKSRGLTQRQMVEELNGLGITTARGGEWSLVQLQRLIARIEAVETVKAAAAPKSSRRRKAEEENDMLYRQQLEKRGQRRLA